VSNLQDQLRILIELQAIDSKIYQLQKEREILPIRIQEMQLNFEEKKKSLNNLEESSKALQLKRKEKELELAAKEENINKLQKQLYQLKTNKEYQTMVKEIDGLRADNSFVEEQIINILDEIDKFKNQIDKEKQHLSDEEKKFNEEKTTIESEIKKIEEELAQLDFKRKQVTANVDPKILSRYERVLKSKDSIAIVPVKDGACQGCFMSLPPQVINEIKMKDRFVSCEVCTRILYIEDEI